MNDFANVLKTLLITTTEPDFMLVSTFLMTRSMLRNNHKRILSTALSFVFVS